MSYADVPLSPPGWGQVYLTPNVESTGTWRKPRSRKPDKNGISEESPTEYPELGGIVIVGRNAAVAKVDISFAGEEFIATGSAKRNVGDEFDYEIGSGLALARAVKALGEELERRLVARVEEKSSEVEPRPDLYENIAQRYHVELAQGYYSPFPTPSPFLPRDDDDNRTAEHDAATEPWT